MAMDKTAAPAASIFSLFLVTCLIVAAVSGCKSRPPVDPDANNNATANTNAGPSTPDPELQRALREAREKNQQLEGQIEILNGQITDLNGQITALNRQLSDAKGEVSNLRTQRANLTNERDNLQKVVNDLRVALDEARRAATSGVSNFTGQPEPVQPAPMNGTRPDLSQGWKRQQMEGSFGFDYPASWKVSVTYGVDNSAYTITAPDGAKMTITVWPYLKGSADELAGERYATVLRDLQDAGVTPTTEQELQAQDPCLAGKPGQCSQIRYEQDGTTWRRRVAAAHLASGGGEDDVFGSMLSVLVEYQWDATNDPAEAMWNEIVSRFWVR